MTPRREALLAFVERFQAEHGSSPSVREMAAELGASPSTVHYHLRVLEATGRLCVERRRSFRLRVVR